MKRIDLGEVPYSEAVSEMGLWVQQRKEKLIQDRLVLLTHPPVITYGARTPPEELPVQGSIPLVAVDRGGQATYHGPGQLIGYLVLPGWRLDARLSEGRLYRHADPTWGHKSRLRVEHRPGYERVLGVHAMWPARRGHDLTCRTVRTGWTANTW